MQEFLSESDEVRFCAYFRAVKISDLQYTIIEGKSIRNHDIIVIFIVHFEENNHLKYECKEERELP